jgi:hypothetical protein
VSAFIVDPFCGTRLICLCSIAEAVIWFWFTGSYQTMNRHVNRHITNLKHGLLSIIFVIFIYAIEKMILVYFSIDLVYHVL